MRGYNIKSKLPGKPDIVYTKYKTAIFVDGCFWHKCHKCFKAPKTNKNFWMKKINNNVLRDRKSEKILSELGYTIIRLWEHDIKNNLELCSLKISKNLEKNGI